MKLHQGIVHRKEFCKKFAFDSSYLNTSPKRKRVNLHAEKFTRLRFELVLLLMMVVVVQVRFVIVNCLRIGLGVFLKCFANRGLSFFVGHGCGSG